MDDSGRNPSMWQRGRSPRCQAFGVELFGWQDVVRVVVTNRNLEHREPLGWFRRERPR